MREIKFMRDVRYLILMRSFGSIFQSTKTDIEDFINTLEVSKCRLIDTNCFIKSCLRDFPKLSLFQSGGVIVMNARKKEGESLAKFTRGKSCTTSSPSMITVRL